MEGIVHKAARLVFGKILPRRPYAVLSGPLRGSRFILGSLAGEGGGASVYFNRIEKEQTAAMLREIGEGHTFFDIGANVGYYSILASKLVGAKGQVIAFEPVVRNIAYLQRHLELNKAENVRIMPFAMSSKSGILSFSPGPNSAMGSLDIEGGSGELLVPTTTLDEIVDLLGLTPDVLKIDVEGAETELFRGGERTLTKTRPKIFLSTHGNERREECLTLLKAKGYTVEALTSSDDPHEFFLKHNP